MWNLTRPDQELGEDVDNITLRGYNEETSITGEFAWKIAERQINPLSVSDISDKYCPTRRDLYLKKGVNRPDRSYRRGTETWGSKAGILVEKYTQVIIEKISEDVTPSYNYRDIIEISDTNHEDYMDGANAEIRRLKRLEELYPEERGNTEWLKKLLKSNGRAEFAFNYLNEALRRSMSITPEDVLVGRRSIIDVPNSRRTHVKQIGINLPAAPDFIIPRYGIIGDIKTGTEFKPHFQLTCAGYALAYENIKRKDNNINWGIIYFFPTRGLSFFRKSVTFAQVYIFPIDNYLRREFLSKRDEAYSVISKKDFPSFPKEKEREHCKHCKFKDFCRQNGLEVRE